MNVDVIESKTKPTQLIQAVENGETVTVCRNGGPAVDIVRTKQRKRKPKLGAIKEQDDRPRLVETDDRRRG